MEIPIQNIYYLLCYAWNKLDEAEVVDVKSINSTELIDLFAKVLINGTSHLLKRGIDRNYIEYEDSLRTIKGKLNISVSCRNNLLKNGMAYCHFDEMNHNILHNQILKVTILNLIRAKQLDTSLREQLVNLYRYFYQIESIQLSYKAFRSVRLHRNNFFYLFLLNICELIYENLLVDENSGETRFKDFIRDEKKMAYVFEEFVRNFYKMELTDCEVYREDLYWGGEKNNLLPKMQTDISIKTAERKIIIDTKYYKEALTTNYDREKIRSNNLYQIYAYLRQVEYKDELSKNADGILLYPTVEDEISFSTEIEGHSIRIETINLNQDWIEIHSSLIQLIKP